MLCCNLARLVAEESAIEGVTRVLNAVLREGRLDRLAIGLSGLCLAHCLATAVFVALLASAGGVLLNPHIHEIGLTFAILLGAIALGQGVLKHGYAMPVWVGSLGLGVMAGAMTLDHDGGEVVCTIVGVLILALGHDLNRRAVA
jgi:hypothetical protein